MSQQELLPYVKDLVSKLFWWLYPCWENLLKLEMMRVFSQNILLACIELTSRMLYEEQNVWLSHFKFIRQGFLINEMYTIHIIIHQTHYEKSNLVESIQSIHNSLWTRHDKCNICCRYYIYHVKFNVCLVTKPLGVFSSETKWLNASLLFLRMNYVKNV